MCQLAVGVLRIVSCLSFTPKRKDPKKKTFGVQTPPEKTRHTPKNLSPKGYPPIPRKDTGRILLGYRILPLTKRLEKKSLSFRTGYYPYEKTTDKSRCTPMYPEGVRILPLTPSGYNYPSTPIPLRDTTPKRLVPLRDTTPLYLFFYRKVSSLFVIPYEKSLVVPLYPFTPEG